MQIVTTMLESLTRWCSGAQVIPDHAGKKARQSWVPALPVTSQHLPVIYFYICFRNCIVIHAVYTILTSGFGPNFCSDYPINSAQRGNPGPQGWQTLWSTEDGSCLDTVNVWEPAKTERGKDDATNPCSGVTANHNAVVYYDDWLSWVPEPTCKTAYGDDSKCGDWGVKVNHQITSFGDIMRIGWGDAMSTSTGQDPAGVQNMPRVGGINYPLFLNYLKDKIRLMGCPESELPFRVSLGRHADWWIGSYGIKKSDMTKAHILELFFPCGGPSWSTNCVAPTQDIHYVNKWSWTTFRFAMQIQVG